MRGAVVFDLDGTLVDSAPDIRDALNRVLVAEGVAPATLAETVGYVGHGVPRLIARARAARGLPEARQEAMVAAMLGHYAAAPAALTRPFAGVPEALAALSGAGYRLGICTNKPEGPAREVLALTGLAQWFGVVVGGDSLPVRKPDPAPLHAAIAALGVPPVAYVGDSEVDAETAVAAGLPFALFTRGYRKAAVADLPHSLAFDDFAALPGWIAGQVRGTG